MRILYIKRDSILNKIAITVLLMEPNVINTANDKVFIALNSLLHPHAISTNRLRTATHHIKYL